MSVLLMALGVSFIVTFLATPVLRRVALSFGACDLPSPRRINKKPVPNLGGVAIYLGILAGILLNLNQGYMVLGILVGSTIIMLVGLLDDLVGLSPPVKMAGQIMAALSLLPFGVEIQFITNPFGGMFFLGGWSIPLTILWVVGITNTVNFIDGLDGLAAGVAAIASGTLAIVALQEGQLGAAIMALIIAGSALAFLFFNFHPAKIFMGDTGAMLLGFILASTSIIGALKSATAMTILVPVLALGVPIADTLLAIVRRSTNGHSIALADKDHIHHRLLRLGLSHRGAVLVVYGTTLFLGLMAVLINSMRGMEGFLLLGLGAVILGLGGWRLGLFRVKNRPGENIYPPL